MLGRTTISASDAPQALLVLDIGSSSTRCTAYRFKHGASLAPIVSSKIPLPSSALSSQGRFNPDALSEVAVKAVDACIQTFLERESRTSCPGARGAPGVGAHGDTAHAPPSNSEHNAPDAETTPKIVGLGISCFGMSLIGTNSRGEAMTPCFSYAERAPETGQTHTPSLRERVARDYPGGIQAAYNRTGAPIHSAYAGPILFGFSSTKPEVYSHIKCWQSFSSFLLSCWSNTPGLPVSYSEASWMGLLDRHTLQWDRHLLEIIGVEESNMAPVADYDSLRPGFRLSCEMIERWPALSEARIFLGIGDGAAANVGSKCTGKHRVAVTIGTSAAVRAVVPRSSVGACVPPGLWCYALDADHSLVGGALTDGGSLHSWLDGVIRNDDLEEQKNNVENSSQADESDSIVVLPFLGGERSPGWNDSARCTIHGITRSTTSRDIRIACMKSVVLRLKAVFSLVDQIVEGGISEIVASGTALKANSLWKQMVADALGCNLIVEAADELTSRGIAVMLLRSLFERKDSKRLGVEMISPDHEIFIPDGRSHTNFAKIFLLQEQLYHQICGKSWLRIGGNQSESSAGDEPAEMTVGQLSHFGIGLLGAIVFGLGFVVGSRRSVLSV